MAQKEDLKKVNTKLIINELHKAFKNINRDFYDNELPEPAILIQSRGNKKLTLGWCSVEKIWKDDNTSEERYEINIVAESLNRGLLPVMGTLMHEMVHLYCLEKEIKDTSRGGTYHNISFKEVAEKKGLVVEDHDNRIGYSFTKVSSEAAKLIYKYKLNEQAFGFARRDIFEEGPEKRKRKTSSRKYICPECGTIIRATKSVNVICEDCGVKFELENPEDFIEPKKVEYVCEDCGIITEVDNNKILTSCPECGSENIQLNTNQDNQQDNIDIDKVIAPIFNEPETPNIIEIDTQLDDGAGNMIDVKQGYIDVNIQEPQVEKWSKTKNTGWDKDRVLEVMREAENQLKEFNEHHLDLEGIEIEIKKVKSYYGMTCGKLVKRGRGAKMKIEKFIFSEEHLNEHPDFDIVDTIKHEYLHAWVDTLKNSSQGHNDIWKRYCEKIGVTPKSTGLKRSV